MIDKARFPDVLSSKRQWICWRLERTQKTDKPTKTPYDPHTGRRASSIDPATWGTLEEAQASYEKYGYTGLGFVFTKEDDIVGVDIDHCRDKETGTLNETATAILGRCATYTEISPSGEGVHLFYLGSIPEGGNKNSGTGVEMYAHSRYFTMTGNRLDGAPLTVESGVDALPWIHTSFVKIAKPEKKAKPQKEQRAKKRTGGNGPLSDEAVLEKAMAADKESRFAKLWAGDWQSLYGSQSEADMALCCKLAFWTAKNRLQMDRLFRQSALFRDKWDVRHHSDGATYGEETLAKAIDLVLDTYQPTTSALVFEYEGRYYRSKNDSIIPLTNFTINPVEMIVSDDETQLTADLHTVRGEVFRHTFLSTDFTNMQKFKTTLNKRTIALSYTGTEGDLELLKTYISELEWDRKKGVKALGMYFHGGRWVYVDAKGAVEAGDKPVLDIVQMERFREKGPTIPEADDLSDAALQELGAVLLGYNEPAKTVAILAWSAGCFIKEHLKAQKYKFPHLFLIGEAGSGKSNTLERVLLPIFSRTRVTAASQVTAFTLMKDSAASNLIPQPLDEFKPSKIEHMKLFALYNHMRTSYDGQEGVRGRADQTSVVYDLSSPLIVAGEESPDEASIRERSIELLFSKKDLKSPEHKAAFRRLQSIPDMLSAYGRALLEAALVTTEEDVQGWYLASLPLFDQKMPPRVLNNLACCMAGLGLLARVCMLRSLDWDQVFGIPLDVCAEHLAFGAKEYLLDGGTANKGIIEQTLEVMARMGLSSDEWRILKDIDRVAINVKKCYDRYTRYRRDFAITGECLSQTEFVKQLRHSDLFVSYSPVRFANGQWRAYVLDFAEIKKRCNIDSFDVTASDLITPWDE